MRFSSTASLAIFAVSANALPLRLANSDFVSRAVVREALREEVQPNPVAVSQDFVVRDLDQTKVTKGLAQSDNLGQPKVAKRLRIFESDSPADEEDFAATGPTQADSDILQRSILNEDVPPPHPVAVSQDLAALDLDQTRVARGLAQSDALGQPKVAKRLRIFESDSPTDEQDFVASGPTQAEVRAVASGDPPSPVAI